MKFKCLTLFWSIHSSHNRLRWSKGRPNFNGIPSTLPRGSFTLKTHQMFSVHPTSREFHSKNPSAVFRPQNSVRISHDCRNAIIFEKLCFQNFCLRENKKSAFLNFRTAHFSWRISVDGRPDRTNKAAVSNSSGARGLRLSAENFIVIGNFLPSHTVTQSLVTKVGNDFVTNYWKVTLLRFFPF